QPLARRTQAVQHGERRTADLLARTGHGPDQRENDDQHEYLLHATFVGTAFVWLVYLSYADFNPCVSACARPSARSVRARRRSAGRPRRHMRYAAATRGSRPEESEGTAPAGTSHGPGNARLWPAWAESIR